ncbi:MAG: phosphoribosyltransferase-like protein [Pseudobdellovibrionaceae bacterium]
MLLERAPSAVRWLKQLDKDYQRLARFMLRRIRYVPNDEFVAGIQKIIKEEAGKFKKVALYPVKKNRLNRFNQSINEDDNTNRVHYDSSVLIGRICESLEREDKRFLCNPTPATLRANRVKKIIYVDDGIFSGRRIEKCWKYQVTPKIKSWMSLKYCKVSFVSFVADEDGIKRAQKDSPMLRKISIKSLIKAEPFRIPDEIQPYDKNQSFGYKGSQAMFAFEHGVTNGMPSFFWNPRVVKDPLFPNRSIPIELINFLNRNEQKKIRLVETITDVNLIKDSLVLHEFNSENLGEAYHHAILALCSSGYTIQRIANILCVSIFEARDLVDYCRYQGWIKDYSLDLSRAGKKRLGVKREELVKKLMKKEVSSKKFYIPKQFKGTKIND